MEAVGQLTGGLAHDFNNLLTAVVGNLDLIRARATEPRITRLAENAFKAAERGSKLTAQLLAFSRTQKLATEPVDINRLIEDMYELLNQSLGANITIKTESRSERAGRDRRRQPARSRHPQSRRSTRATRCPTAAR